MPSIQEIPPNIPPHILDTAVQLISEVNGRLVVPIIGRSMYPRIREGDEVIVAAGLKNFRFGSVIVFRQGRQLFARQVVGSEVTPTGVNWITMGDSTTRRDAPVPEDAILGEVIAIRRKN